ncbi:MAG: N(5)-(carboxyethyl)ornithine synthase [Candidatus Nanopelagicales bacterium]|jgi:alanine dehydrogenase|nr:N(5)-(carboxyethyl)ornithine synthase [Candidatus Nanopelagicales bacterium]
MDLLTLGVLGTSSKENEKRLPIHPHHIGRIEADLRARMVLETGYGQRYGVSDAHLAHQVGAMVPHREVLEAADVVLLPKPTLADLHAMRDGQVLWGWPHAVQDPELTQIAIDKHLTLIAWEAMNHWTPRGSFMVHVFHLNNELAGYCSVLHAMTLTGTTGAYGRHHRAAVIGFGNTARGAINALRALEIHDITVLTMRDVTAVASPIPGIVLDHMDRMPEHPGRATVRLEDGSVLPVATFLGQHDIVVNCVLQDTDRPLMFVTEAELAGFATGSLVIDVSCDRGMGFEFARPTSFEAPMVTVGDGVTYYGVDHSPAYLWNSATWTISEALIPYLRPVMSGPAGWDADVTIRRAIEIREGVVQNPKILSFQGRSDEFPHVPR